MRFGICVGMEQIDAVGRMGFDYLEAALAPLAALTETEFEEAAAQAEKASIPVECCNLMFPGDMALTGPNVDYGRITAYLETAFSRMRRLGSRLVVFGSGRSRSYPAGTSYREGCRQLAKTAAYIGETAAKFGITVALEPLNTRESNLINTLTEGAMLLAQADAPALGLLADSYHLFQENEPMEHILRVGDLVHTHVALLEKRAYPTRPDPQLEGFFQALRQIGYTGRMSIEGWAECFETDAPAALAVLRRMDAQG